jgi:hypothetical protein
MHAEGRATLSAVRRRAGQSSRCRLLTQHGGDLLPAIDPEQLDLIARHEAEEQNDGGVLRSRLRSLWTQQGCTAARGHTKPTARRRPALPSTMHPRRERFAAAEVKGEQLLAAVDQDADDAEDRDAYHLAGAADAQGEARRTLHTASQQSDEGPSCPSGQGRACEDQPTSRRSLVTSSTPLLPAAAGPRSSSGVTETAKAGRGSGWDGDHARGPTVVPFFAHLMGAAAASSDDRTNSAWAPHPPPHKSIAAVDPATIRSRKPRLVPVEFQGSFAGRFHRRN